MKYRICSLDNDSSVMGRQHIVIQGFADTLEESSEAAQGLLKSHDGVIIEKVELIMSSEDRKKVEALL